MKSYKRNNKGILRFLGFSLSTIMLLGSVTAFAGAKATLQGGSLYFENLIETKEENIIRSKITGHQAEDIKQKISVEYIEAGSEIVLEGAKDLDGTIVGVLSRSELNKEGTRITKSTVEATIAGDKVHLGTMNLDDITGITAEQSIGLAFDNKNLPGAILGDEKALYELQLLFTPKSQKPFFYTYYLRLVSTNEGNATNTTNTTNATNAATDNSTAIDTSTNITDAPQIAPAVDNTIPDTVATVDNTIPDTVATVDNTVPDTVATVDNPVPDTVATVDNTVPNTVSNGKTTVKGIETLPSSTKININGKIIDCEVYTINNLNYFKLRDFAMALNNMPKSFSVNWIEAQKTITLNSHAAYNPIGDELVLSEQYLAGGKFLASTMQSNMLFDNASINLDGYVIKGNTYFQLRDLAQLIDISVQYNQASDTMVFDTNKIYEQ